MMPFLKVHIHGQCLLMVMPVKGVAKGNKVDFNGDSSNITVERAGKKITTKLNKDITVDSVKANNKVTVGTAAKQLVLDGTTGVMTVGIGTNVIN